ncbi:MAG: single-stranded DNA-binding protein [Synergistaceae bacterium]|nr:single-stranded DNA-binding protein [Synergistaceae bacterium]
MRGYNKAVIAGNLTRDPEMRYTVDKRAYARFGVAVNYNYKTRNGELKEEVDFIPVTVWGSMAENCGKYLRKGRPVIVEGRIRVSTYDAKDGSGKRTSTEIWATDVVFLGGGRSDNDSQSQGSQYSGAPYPSASSANNYSSAAQPQDMPPFDPYGSGDDSFGSSIDDKGFDGDFAPDFNASSNSSSGSGKSEAEIPF